MLGAYAQSCCCDPTCEKDCIWQTEIESGCCHKDDTLLLWCERPGYSIKTAGGCIDNSDPLNPVYDEFCCEKTQPTESPIQAIYHYHSCWWRCIPITATNAIGSVSGLAEMCPPAVCEYEGVGDPPVPVATPCQAYLDGSSCTTPACGMALKFGCCNDPAYNSQIWNNNCVDCCSNCNDEGMSEWRRRRMGSTDQWKWAVESICHKDGQALGSSGDCDTITYSGGSFSNCTRLGGLNRAHQMLAVVHFERWWRIADCPEGVRIYVPGCTQGPGGVNCGGNIYQTDDLVPKWWIFACSGIPLYAGDLIDAVRFGVIEQAEAEQLLEDLFGTCTHPEQAVLIKLANAGYIRANDWRDEQRTAYQELDAKFPGAGYNTCIEDVDQMHTLGPFRKRMTYKTVGTSNQPLLRKVDVVDAHPDLNPLQADCFITYPGPTSGATAQADYDYWCERQWIYFRGRPGGWTWAGWDANVCPGDEILSILIGDARGAQNCIEALKGGGRSPGTQSACTCCNTSASFGIPMNCRGCAEYDCALPLPSCDPPELCESFSIKPYCEGLRIKYTNYKADMTFVPGSGSSCNPGPQCGYCYKIRCLYMADSFLVGAKRSVDSWLDSIPFTCRPEKPPLPVFNSWGTWPKSHPAPPPGLCNLWTFPGQDQLSWCWGCGCPDDGADPCAQSEYSNRACCGAVCLDGVCDCDPTAVDPTVQINTECGPDTDCPPHGTTGQIDCIGFTPDCDEGV